MWHFTNLISWINAKSLRLDKEQLAEGFVKCQAFEGLSHLAKS